jgi:hypothetical protein
MEYTQRHLSYFLLVLMPVCYYFDVLCWMKVSKYKILQKDSYSGQNFHEFNVGVLVDKLG